MPTSQEFIDAFDLEEGNIHGNYFISRINVVGQEISWNEYRFLVDIDLEEIHEINSNIDSANDAIRNLIASTGMSQNIISQDGLEYMCVFQYPNNSVPKINADEGFHLINLKFTGYARRLTPVEGYSM